MRLRLHRDGWKKDQLDGECESCGEKFQSLHELDEHITKMHKGDIHTGREDGQRKPIAS